MITTITAPVGEPHARHPQLVEFELHKIFVSATTWVIFTPFTTRKLVEDEFMEPQRLCTQLNVVAHGQNSATPPTAITAANGLFGFAETAFATAEQDS